MKKTCQVPTVLAAVLSAALLLAPLSARGQAPIPVGARQIEDSTEAVGARRIAERFERDARILTVFDRQGNALSTLGETAIYEDPVLSPDGTRLAVTMEDLESQTEDLWVLDLATGSGIQITFGPAREEAWTPVWSPDSSQVAYVALRGGYEGLYRKASNGEGAEELLYQHPGAGMRLTDWSLDGRFLSFFTTDLSGGTLYVLPIGEDTPIEILRSEFQLRGPSLSPDSRFLSYTSDESGTNQVYIRTFDMLIGDGTTQTRLWQVSAGGGQAIFANWREDGKELYYAAADGGVMAVDVQTTPTVEFGPPKLLFRLSEAVTVAPGLASVARDGQQILVAVPHAPTLQQITVFDRQGDVLSTVGESGRYRDQALSPDGTRVAVRRIVPETGNEDVWTFDVASGKGTPVTNDTSPDSSPIWSPDGRQVAYQSRRGIFSSIYLKAWDGRGNEEQVFQYTPGAVLWVTDWSADGRFLTFHDGCDGVLHVVPLGGDQDALGRTAIEWLRDEYNVAQARFSPDSRFMAYLSNELEAGIFEVYVRSFDPTQSDVSAGGEKPVQVSTAGARGMIFWRQDGKELYYLTPQWEVMAVDVTTTPAFQAGTPRLLFTLPGALVGNPLNWRNISADGQRFVFVLDVPVSVSAR